MLQIHLNNIHKKDLIVHLAFNSVVLTFLLAFIDEGAYNFSWMKDTSSWGAILIYFSMIYLTQLFLFKLALGKFEKLGKITSYSFILGAITLMLSLGLSN